MKSRCQPSSSVSGSSVATSSQTTTKKTASPKQLPGKYRHLPSGLFWRRIWRKHCGHVLQSPNVGPVLSSFSTSVHVDAAASVTLVRVGSCLCRSSSPHVFWWIVDRGELAECAQSVSGSYSTLPPLLLGASEPHTPASMVLFFIILFQHCHTYSMSCHRQSLFSLFSCRLLTESRKLLIPPHPLTHWSVDTNIYLLL